MWTDTEKFETVYFRKKDKEVLTKAFKLMYDIKKVAWKLLDVPPQTKKGKELAIKFRGQKIKKGRIIFQWTIKFGPLMIIINNNIKKPSQNIKQACS